MDKSLAEVGKMSKDWWVWGWSKL